MNLMLSIRHWEIVFSAGTRFGSLAWGNTGREGFDAFEDGFWESAPHGARLRAWGRCGWWFALGTPPRRVRGGKQA